MNTYIGMTNLCVAVECCYSARSAAAKSGGGRIGGLLMVTTLFIILLACKEFLTVESGPRACGSEPAKPHPLLIRSSRRPAADTVGRAGSSSRFLKRCGVILLSSAFGMITVVKPNDLYLPTDGSSETPLRPPKALSRQADALIKALAAFALYALLTLAFASL